jgi:hypothetical protein
VIAFSTQIDIRYNNGSAILEVDQTVVKYQDSLPRIQHFGEGALIELRSAIKVLESLTPKREETYNISVEDWLRSNVESLLVKRILHSTIKTLFGDDVDRISLHFFLEIVKNAGSYRTMMLTQGDSFLQIEKYQVVLNRIK